MLLPLTFVNGFFLIMAVEGSLSEGDQNELAAMYEDFQDVHLIPSSSFQRDPKLPRSFIYASNSAATSKDDPGSNPAAKGAYPNYANYVNDMTDQYYSFDATPEVFNKDEVNEFLQDAIYKSFVSKRRLPLPLGPIMGFPIKSHSGSGSRNIAFSGIGKGVQRRSNRRPTACSFGTFGLVCWNASLRKNRVQGGNFEITR